MTTCCEAPNQALAVRRGMAVRELVDEARQIISQRLAVWPQG
jgi:hypothetical protein